LAKKRLLEVDGLETYYGLSQALFGVSLTLHEGEIVCVLGRNGAGKTTTLRSIMGLSPPRRGRVLFGAQDITGWRPDQVARAGIGWVPEERRIFGKLTAEENLLFAFECARRQGAWTLERIYGLFPKLLALRHQLGAQLSGGEQQMLAIARTLAVNPRVILLDEPCEGLAPVIVSTLGEAIRSIRDAGTAVLLVEQNAKFALRHSTRAYVLDNGRVQLETSAQALRESEQLQQEYLGVSGSSAR
jgi:branched-chain amino acid transport system ATP-binding protein